MLTNHVQIIRIFVRANQSGRRAAVRSHRFGEVGAYA
jgi:hypothetical protein